MGSSFRDAAAALELVPVLLALELVLGVELAPRVALGLRVPDAAFWFVDCALDCVEVFDTTRSLDFFKPGDSGASASSSLVNPSLACAESPSLVTSRIKFKAGPSFCYGSAHNPTKRAQAQ